MKIRVLGSGAGGGVPQWNSAGLACRLARAGDARSPARTQASLAVSADGERWALLDASPDLRAQIAAASVLHPRPGRGLRGSPIAAVVLSGAEIDRITGLLTLRERQAFSLYATGATHAVLDENPIFDALARDLVPRRRLALEVPCRLEGADGAPLGLELLPFAVPGKAPLFDEQRARTEDALRELSVGLEVRSGETSFFYLPGCAAVPGELAARLRDAPLVFFDGTLFSDDEMIRQGAGAKTGARMGHVSLSGERGTLRAFAELGVRQKVLIHLNNTNPAIVAGTEERAIVEAAGWRVACDGEEYRP